MPWTWFEQLGLIIASTVLLIVIAWVFVGERSWAGLPAGGRHKAPALVIVASLTLILGTIGFYQVAPLGIDAPSVGVAPPSARIGTRVVNALYSAAQHLFLNAPTSPTDNMLIALSRLCGLATAVLVAIEALRRLFAESIERALLSLRRGHIVVCGLGEIGSGLIEDIACLQAAGAQTRLQVTPSDGARSQRKLDALWKPLFNGPVAIEINPSTGAVVAARELGATVVLGAATDEWLLKRVGADRAREVFFVTGNDEDNLAGASHLLHMLAVTRAKQTPGKTPEQSEKRLRLFVQLRHTEVERMLEMSVEHASSEKLRRPVEACPFNVINNAAQSVVIEQLLTWRPKDRSSVAHFVIVGFGAMSQALALKLAELAHFENCKRSRMTIVYSAKDAQAVAEFREIYPLLFSPEESAECAQSSDPWNPVSQMDDWAYGVRVTDPSNSSAVLSERGVAFVFNGGWVQAPGAPRTPDFVDHIVRLARGEGVKPIVFVSQEPEDENASLALELRGELDSRLRSRGPGNIANPVPIFAYVPRRPRLSAMLDKLHRSDLVAFGASREACSYEALTWPANRRPAEFIAEHFDAARQAREGESLSNSDVLRPLASAPTQFSQRDLWERRSNLAAAAHVSIKVAALGLRLVRKHEVALTEPKEPVRLTPEQRECLARMEHNRWLAERLLSGWTFGPRSDSARKRTAMVDWERLDISEREKDFDQVDQTLAFCRQSNDIALVR